MRELIFSMMRFSGSVAMFGIEQVQSAAGAPTDTRAAINRMRGMLDLMSESLASMLDRPKQAALESISKAQSEMMARTLNVVDLNAAGEFMMNTSKSLSSAVSRSANGKAAGTV
jgi:hypothetical protein